MKLEEAKAQQAVLAKYDDELKPSTFCILYYSISKPQARGPVTAAVGTSKYDHPISIPSTTNVNDYERTNSPNRDINQSDST